MFYSCDSEKIRTVGRWADDKGSGGRLSCTACGAKIECRFRGTQAVFRFDTSENEVPFPHVWIRVDGGAKTEAALSDFLRVQAAEIGWHRVEIVYKSAMEQQARWALPLAGKITFLGVFADELLPLPEYAQRTIEFVGDSITEGVLVDAPTVNDTRNYDGCQPMRPYQDDVTATYAYLTAEKLNLEPLFMGYGAVGVTRGGMGGVPKCADAYPYAFEGVPKRYANPNAILINHGANDRSAGAEAYLREYGNLLDLIFAGNPESKVIALSAFCGAYHEELGAFIAAYNREHGRNVAFIDSAGWIPSVPLHPTREGHRAVAERLAPILKSLFEG